MGAIIKIFWNALNYDRAIIRVATLGLSGRSREFKKVIKLYPFKKRKYAMKFAYHLLMEGRTNIETIKFLEMHSRFI